MNGVTGPTAQYSVEAENVVKIARATILSRSLVVTSVLLILLAILKPKPATQMNAQVSYTYVSIFLQGSYVW